MRFVTFETAGAARLGLVEGGEVADLGTVALIDAIRGGEAALAQTAKAAKGPRLPLDGLALLPVIPRPGKIICLGLNYAEHAAEGGREKPDYPNFFMRCATSLVGHGAPVVRPRVSEQLDFEAELAAVIGRTVPRHVERARAL